VSANIRSLSVHISYIYLRISAVYFRLLRRTFKSGRYLCEAVGGNAILCKVHFRDEIIFKVPVLAVHWKLRLDCNVKSINAAQKRPVVCSEIEMKHMNNLWLQNVEFLSVKPGGTWRNLWAFEGYWGHRNFLSWSDFVKWGHTIPACLLTSFYRPALK
jgi:hypothetical protein